MRSALVVLAAAALLLTACGGSPRPAPSPSAVPLRPIDVCEADVVVPEDAVQAVPSATAPPTVVLTTGDAVGFDVPAGARVGLPDDSVGVPLCTAPTGTPVSDLLVATDVGYGRVTLQVGIEAPTQVLVKVTP